jgi:hypothetical protein
MHYSTHSTDRARKEANARRTEKRRAQKEQERRDAEHQAARIAPVVARLLRREPTLSRSDAEYAATCILSTGADPLVFRGKPVLFPRWREDMDRALAYLFCRCGEGLPLAHEGGSPIRTRDDVTAELATRNGRARMRAEGWRRT